MSWHKVQYRVLAHYLSFSNGLTSPERPMTRGGTGCSAAVQGTVQGLGAPSHPVME